MLPRWLRLLLLLALLFPATRFLYLNREMPSFGRAHDDGLFFVSAKGLAEGRGYRILSLPGAPPQTKYPVLYPLYLSLIWRINPNFPDNLHLAALFCWMPLMAALVLAFFYYRLARWPEPRLWVTFALLALNPWMEMIGSTLFSEMLFLAFLLAALIALEKAGIRMAALAGVLAGCAYLTRSAAIALLVSAPAVLLWKRERARAAAFLAAMLPFAAAWMTWTHFHTPTATDPTTIYYTNYFALERANVDFGNIGLVVWKNLDSFLSAAGGFFLPNVISGPAMKMLTEALAVGAVAGAVRLARRGVFVQYALFSLISTLIVLVWTECNERLILPMLPLLAAGAVEEARHFWRLIGGAFRHRDRSQRAAAYVTMSAASMLAVAGISAQLWISLFVLPGSIPKSSAADLAAAGAWLKSNTPESARVLSGDDPVLYLYSGRQGNDLPFMYRWIYAEENEKFLESYRNIVSYCASHGFAYVLVAGGQDTALLTNDRDRAQILREIAENPGLKPVFHAGQATIYRVAPQKITEAAQARAEE